MAEHPQTAGCIDCRKHTDVGNTADIDDGAGVLRVAEYRCVKRWNQWRALAACCDVGGAEVVHHRYASGFSQLRGVEQLNRVAVGGTVANGLTMRADCSDLIGSAARSVHRLVRCLRVQMRQVKGHSSSALEIVVRWGLQPLDGVAQD